MNQDLLNDLIRKDAVQFNWTNKTGIELGDLVDITNNPCQETLNLQGPPKGKLPRLPVVGFATVKNQTYAIVKHPGGGVWYEINKSNCIIHELDDSVILEDNLYFVHIKDITSLTNSKKETTTMSKPSVIETVKNDAVEGAYRAGGRKAKKLVQDSTVNVLEKAKLKGPVLDAVSDFLKTDVGKGLIGYGLGEGLPHLPKVGKTKQVAKLAKEFRVDGLADIETVVFDSVGAALGPLFSLGKDLLKPEAAPAPKQKKEKAHEVPEELVTVPAGGKSKKK